MTYEQQRIALSLSPIDKEVARHEFGKFDYFLIQAQYLKLDAIFGEDKWSWEVKQSYFEADSFLVVGNLTLTFANGVIKVLSGVGAAQVRRSSSTGQFIAGGATMDFPNAESKAFKNAVEKLSVAFGRNLRRDPELTGKTVKKASETTINTLEKRNNRINKMQAHINGLDIKGLEEWLNKYPSGTTERVEFGLIVEARLQKLEREVKNDN